MKLIVSQLGDSYDYLETSPVLIFDVLGGPEALELAVDHDAHFGTEGLRLFHGMSRKDDCALLSQS